MKLECNEFYKDTEKVVYFVDWVGKGLFIVKIFRSIIQNINSLDNFLNFLLLSGKIIFMNFFFKGLKGDKGNFGLWCLHIFPFISTIISGFSIYLEIKELSFSISWFIPLISTSIISIRTYLCTGWFYLCIISILSFCWTTRTIFIRWTWASITLSITSLTLKSASIISS